MDYLALVLSVIGIILNAKHIRESWLVWALSNIFWGVHFASKGDSVALIWMVLFFGLNMWGYMKWKGAVVQDGTKE